MLLYAVTDRAWVGKQSLYEQVESALKGGATCVQLREKEMDDEAFLNEAIEISALCKQYRVPFFINDNVEIAIKCHADGIHVGQEDMEAAQVRQRVGDDMIIGVSVHSVDEALDAVKNGADEIDMVINIGWLKDGRLDDILDEINRVKEACDGRLLKVIIETCLLTDEEKIDMCRIVSLSGADYIKTSTGFSVSGANAHDIKLFCDNVSGDLKIKAAGGISSIEDAEEFIMLGASRLGTSRIVKIVKNIENGEKNDKKDSSY